MPSDNADQVAERVGFEPTELRELTAVRVQRTRPDYATSPHTLELCIFYTESPLSASQRRSQSLEKRGIVPLRSFSKKLANSEAASNARMPRVTSV